MTNNINLRKIVEVAVEEAAKELGGKFDEKKINDTIKTIDIVEIVEGAVRGVMKDVGPDQEKLKIITRESAKAAILEGLKRLP